MSAQEFKPGDRVRCIRSSATSSNPAVTAGDEYVIAVRDGDMVSVDGMPSYWWSTDRFEKVEPEFVVGQQVSGDDYARLPVGSVAGNWTQVAADEWAWLGQPSRVRATSMAAGGARTLTHLPDATEPEDKDDLYVEPEPLKEGDAVRALAQAIIWTREYVGEATLPAMKGWSWYDALREYAPEFLPEEPTQCTSLYEYEEGKYVRCCRASGHANPGHQGYGKGWLAESARLADGGAS